MSHPKVPPGRLWSHRIRRYPSERRSGMRPRALRAITTMGIDRTAISQPARITTVPKTVDINALLTAKIRTLRAALPNRCASRARDVNPLADGAKRFCNCGVQGAQQDVPVRRYLLHQCVELRHGIVPTWIVYSMRRTSALVFDRNWVPVSETWVHVRSSTDWSDQAPWTTPSYPNRYYDRDDGSMC